MTKMISVNCTNHKAVYIDGTRITHRGTKWGIHTTVHQFVCRPHEVAAELKAEKLFEHLKNIKPDFFKEATGEDFTP